MAGKLRVMFAIGDMSGGGSQRQLIGILRLLDRERFVPHLYLVAPGGELLSEVPPDVPVFIFAERRRPPTLPLPGAAHAARIRDLAGLLREQRIDLLYDRTYHMTLTAAPAARRAGVPHISVIVADPERDFGTNTERFRFIKRHLLRSAYRSATKILAVSDGVRAAAEHYYGLVPGRAATLYNFYDTERIGRLAHEPLPAADHKPPGRFEIVAAGRLHPQKGFLHLLAALQIVVKQHQHAQVHLRILGHGPQEAELKAQIAEHGLTDHVTLAGFRANPLPYYRQADLFCLSSLYEGMPNALVEAILCGTPALSTDCPSGPRELLEDGALGRLVPPADPSALAGAIEDALQNHAEWRSRVPLAQAAITKRFALEPGVRRLEAILEETARQRRT